MSREVSPWNINQLDLIIAEPDDLYFSRSWF